MCLCTFILLVVSAIVLGVVSTRGRVHDNDSYSTPAPTPEPTTVEQASLSEFLVKSASFDDGAALYNQQRPQYKAAKWLANNNTRIDDFTDKQKIQATLRPGCTFFSANGGGWTDNTNWLDDGDECGR